MESGSSIGKFMLCPKRYYYEYELKLKSPHYSKALGFGSLIHAFIEAKMNPEKSGEAQKVYEETLAEYPNDHEQIEADHHMAQELAEIWFAFWDTTGYPFANREFKWLETESEWKFGNYTGKSDGVVQSLKWNKTFLYELKTAADRSRDTYRHKLEMDKQISANILGQRERGHNLDGVVYDIIYKPALVRKTNRKTMPDETFMEFAQRIISAVREKPEAYFERTIVYRTDKDLAEYQIDLAAQLKHLEAIRASNEWYRNQGACESFGSLCPFFGACLEGKEEMLEQFKKKPRKHEELNNA